MVTIDAHSYFSPEHPLLEAGCIRYLLAPPIDRSGAAIAGFAGRMKKIDADRAAGGLLPVQGVDDSTFAAALEDPFWRGLLLTPVYDGGELAGAEVLERLALPAARTLPIVVEAGVEGFSRPQHLERLLTLLPAEVPDRPVVLTHGGQLNISGSHLEAAAALFRAFPHTCLETSGIYRQDFLEEMLLALGPARILYGSGHPWMDERLELERVRILPAASGDLAAMLGGNAMRLFALPARDGMVDTAGNS